MDKVKEFFIKKGISLDEVLPGSGEVAFDCDTVNEAIELLRKNWVPILGGDVLTKDSFGKLRYAHSVLGPMYHGLSWYYESKRIDDIDGEGYVWRSYDYATSAVHKALKVANKLERDFYFLLVLDDVVEVDDD